MAGSYSWEDAQSEAIGRDSGPDRLRWWAVAALLMSVLLHVIVFFALDRIQIALGIQNPAVLDTAPVVVREVERQPMDFENLPPPEDLAVPPADTAALLEDVDILQALPKNEELDIRPDIEKEEYAIQMANPAASGDPETLALEIASGLEADSDLPEPGRMEDTLPPAALGQVTVDPGSALVDDPGLGKFTEELIKKGANGQVDRGALDGMASLDDLLGLPANELMGKKTMLPSDLLFEFNSTQLRESAKVGLMKLGLLIDLNPELYCWIEGHTDLVGGEEFNLELSRKRAEAVKDYLVRSLRMDGSRIYTRGLGKSEPLVAGGSVEEQAPNRRVEIRMRKTPPPKEAPVKVSPPKAVPAPVSEEPPPPKAVLVKPNVVLPVEEAPPPRAERVIEEEPLAPRAQPVEEEIPRARPVEEPGALRAVPVEEGE